MALCYLFLLTQATDERLRSGSRRWQLVIYHQDFVPNTSDRCQSSRTQHDVWWQAMQMKTSNAFGQGIKFTEGPLLS